MSKNPFKKNKHEIKYNIINSALAGGLIFVGSIIDGNITAAGIIAAFGAAVIACLIKFKDYWATQKKEYLTNIINFI